MSASRFEHLAQKAWDELFNPIDDFDCSSKAIDAESEVTMLREMETKCNTFGVIRLALVIG